MSLFDQFPYTNLHELNLDWVVRKLKEVSKEVGIHHKRIEELEQQIKELGDNIDELVRQWLEEQGPQVAQEWIAKWIQTSVWFGLTDGGYWCAWIPESWKTIQFETTGLDVSIPIQPEYGHLVLSY